VEKLDAVVFVYGRTASGFNKWLRKRGLKTIPAKKLAELVYRTIVSFEEKTPREARAVVEELCRLTGATDPETRRELVKQFSRLCDTYLVLMKVLEAWKEYSER